MLIMQRKNQFPTNNLKMTRPPPVPPRPDKSLVADALAKTRKLPSEYQNTVVTKTSTPPNPQSTQQGQVTNISPKLNGLSRVKSFIRDVINDKKSTDEKKQQSGNSSLPKSSASKTKDDSKSQLPVSSTFKTQNGKRGKFGFSSNGQKVEDTPKKMLSRSLSSSVKSEQKSLINGDKIKDSNRVLKSNSFAEKVFPMRRAPPPPISPKPNKKNVDKFIIKQDNYQQVLKLSTSCEELSTCSDRPIVYSSKLPKISTNRELCTEAKMETNSAIYGETKQDFCNPVSENIEPLTITGSTSVTPNIISEDNINTSLSKSTVSSIHTSPSSLCKKEDCAFVDNTIDEKNIGDYVTRKLISEILEANKPENINNKEVLCNNLNFIFDKRDTVNNKTTVLLNGDTLSPKAVKTGTDNDENLKRLNDISNHELLISELESMRREAYVKKSDELLGDKTPNTPDSQISDPFGISRHSSVQSFSFGSISNNDDCDACLVDDDQFYVPSELACRLQEQFYTSQKMAALRGLPPLPKSLSSFGDMVQRINASTTAGEDDSVIVITPTSTEDPVSRLAVNGTGTESHRRTPTTLDSQLAVLRKEMLGLRQLDLSLLSQLWTLNEAIHEWRQEVEQRRASGSSTRLRPAPPPPPPPISPSSSEERSSRSVEYVSS